MKRDIARSALVVAAAAIGLSAAVLAAPAATSTRAADSPELGYLKTVNAWRPPADPQVLLLLMSQFANAGKYQEGADFIEELRARFDPVLSDTWRAKYLATIAALRAGAANKAFLFRRLSLVREAVRELDEAKKLTLGSSFLERWMSGIVRAEIPEILGERDTAITDLVWCVDHARQAPHAGWMREVYASLAQLRREQGLESEAHRLQELSGLPAGARPARFTTPFQEDPQLGHRFSQRAIREVVPGTVYALSGFEFTEYYFIVSADHRQLIAIDAGTRNDSAKAAFEALEAQVPNLPPLTSVFVTHAHWDHVGGHRYFRSLNPSIKFYGRRTFASELRLDAAVSPVVLRRFFGDRFNMDDVLSYRPDVGIDERTEITVGGSRFTLIPTQGGETSDALLIHMPEQGVLFAGDVFMPYFGAPFVEEGSIEGMLSSIRQIVELQPRILLHGHEPLTRIFSSTRMLSELAPCVRWLGDEVRTAIPKGITRAQLQHANLIPPMLEKAGTDVHLAYLVLRENLINRMYDQLSGYWRNGLQGLDALTDADRGSALADYLGVSEDAIASATTQLVADGKHDMAAALATWGLARFPDSEPIRAARRLAYLKLSEKFQAFNPFKFILYTEQGGLPSVVAPEGEMPLSNPKP